jgi:hypothetical protein
MPKYTFEQIDAAQKLRQELHNYQSSHEHFLAGHDSPEQVAAAGLGYLVARSKLKEAKRDAERLFAELMA